MGAALALLRVVPVWAWALAALLAWGAFQKHTAVRATRAAEQAAASAQVHAATAEAQRQAREQEAAYEDQARRAADAYATTISRARRDAAAALSERDQLRDAIAAAPAGSCGPSASAPATGRADGAAALRDVLGACAGVVQELAAAADADAARLIGLQAHIRATTPAP